MNKKQKREIIQLFLAAKHFFNISKKRFNKLSSASQQIRMKDLAKKFENFTWSTEDKGLLILTSYLSSCDIRISTIYEVMKIKPNNEALYGKKSLDIKHICHFLRDNVCHREPEEEEKKFKKRQDFIEGLTIKQLYEETRNALIECKSTIVDFSNNYKALGNDVKKIKII
jgi:hypothetical protein